MNLPSAEMELMASLNWVDERAPVIGRAVSKALSRWTAAKISSVSPMLLSARLRPVK